jgi:flagellar biosynthetic protein FlhB
MSDDKTEEPSEQKLRKAREDGDVPKSAELTGALVMITAGATALITINSIGSQWISLTHRCLDVALRPQLDLSLIPRLLEDAIHTTARMTGPVLATAFAAAAFFNYVQVGALITLKPLKPDINKLNPVNGFKQMFSKDKFVDLFRNIIKLAAMAYLGFSVLVEHIPPMTMLPRSSLQHGMAALGAATFDLVKLLIGLMFVLGAIDIVLQKKRYTKRMRMSKEEVKREHKDSEGDAQTKGQRQQFHQELLHSAGTRRVKEADAVVVNPTHVAVAILYNPDQMQAPTVVARGKGAEAQLIKRLARRYQVPIIHNVTLARTLVELDNETEIPPDLYDTVAEILRFVYSLKKDHHT